VNGGEIMKIISIIIAAITVLLLLSTLMCGLWIKSKGLTDVGSLNFHMQIGIGTVIFGLISVILLMFKTLKN